MVDYIAKQLGIKKALVDSALEIRPGTNPKLAQDHIVAMVGDGINDAPALAAANVSFAMKSGSDVPEQTASATLMQHSVNQLVDALFITIAAAEKYQTNLFLL